MTTMIDQQTARIRTHRNNIHRYQRLLRTRLTDLEREFLERRLAEEQSQLEGLTSSAHLHLGVHVSRYAALSF